MAVRDNVLPALNRAWRKIASLGFQRTSVMIRVRTWAGARVGDNAGQSPGFADVLTPISPTPSVSMMSPYAVQMAGIMTSAGDV